MFPAFMVYNFTNYTRGYSKFIAQIFVRIPHFPHATNVQNLHFSKFCFAHFSAFGVPILKPHIKVVVVDCSENQMPRIDAFAVVTTVQNKKARFNRSIKQFIRQSMGKYCAPIWFCATQLKFPVSSRVYIRNPKPTSSGFFDLFKKSFFNGDGSARINTGWHFMGLSQCQ